MGISGLTHHVSRKLSRWVSQEKEFGADSTGSRTPLVVDLSGWAWMLYLNLLRRSPIWGVNLDDMDLCIQRFLEMCITCSLEPVFVADGPSPTSKDQTRSERVASRMQLAQEYMVRVARSEEDPTRFPPKLSPVLPPGRMQVMTSMLKSKGVEVVHSLGEADGLVARMARERQGLALTNDSDFFILQSHEGGCHFAFFRELVTLAYSEGQDPTDVTRTDAWFDPSVSLGTSSDSSLTTQSNSEQRLRLSSIRLTVYNPERLAQVWRIPMTLLPVVAVFTQNDYATDEYKRTLRQSLGNQFDQILSALLVMIRDEASRLGRTAMDELTPRLKLAKVSASVLARIVLLASRSQARRGPAIADYHSQFPPRLQERYNRLWPNILACLDVFTGDEADPAMLGLFGPSPKVDTTFASSSDQNCSVALGMYKAAYHASRFPTRSLTLLGRRTMRLPEFSLFDPTLPSIYEGEFDNLYQWSVSIVLSANPSVSSTIQGLEGAGPPRINVTIRTSGGESRVVRVREVFEVYHLTNDVPLPTTGSLTPPVLLPERQRQLLFCSMLRMHPSLLQLMLPVADTAQAQVTSHSTSVPLPLVYSTGVLALAIRDLGERAPASVPWTRTEVQAGVLALCASQTRSLDPKDAEWVRGLVREVQQAVSTPTSRFNLVPSIRPTTRSLHLATSLSSLLMAAYTLYTSLLLPFGPHEGLLFCDTILFQQAVCAYARHDALHPGLETMQCPPNSVPQRLLAALDAALSGVSPQ